MLSWRDWFPAEFYSWPSRDPKPFAELGCARPERLRILIISTSDTGGGAEHSAWNLFRAYRARGHGTWLAVGDKRTGDPDVKEILNEACRTRWARAWLSAAEKLERTPWRFRGVDRLRYLMQWMGEPRRLTETSKGYEDFHYPGIWRLLRKAQEPDVIHCFNLHGGYFDLRALPRLSRQCPLILDLRDAWLLSGHCAHSFDCERWRTGCGQCPDLTIYPAIRQDRTADNWQRKREIFARSRLYVSTPSRWLMNRVEQSMLGPVMIEGRVIPSGINLTVFRRANKQKTRAALGIERNAIVLFFAANGIRRNRWKDYQMMRRAIALVAERLQHQKLFSVALGEDGPPEQIGRAKIVFVPYQRSPETVAAYYQAADLYVHAAKADTFPRVVLEAIACGAPVVATAVGGIPEQVKGAQGLGVNPLEENRYGSDQATGVLVPAGNAQAMAEAIIRLVSDEALRRQMSENAIRDAQERFNLELQVDRYLAWYRELALGTAAQESSVAIAV